MLLGFLVPALGANEGDYPKTEWRVDEAKLSCTPKRLRPNDTLTIRMPVPHSQELAVYYPKSRSWWFLVYWPDPSMVGAKPIMSREEFVTTPVLKLKVKEAKGARWIGNPTDELIFVHPGTYSIHLSDALESEAGGYSCTVEYVPDKK
jgi:hypothetical protein